MYKKHTPFESKFELKPVCGKRTTSLDTIRISEGTEATPGDWPWMALLGLKYEDTDEDRYHCSGTLISLTNVLTGAHCLYKRLKNR